MWHLIKLVSIIHVELLIKNIEKTSTFHTKQTTKSDIMMFNYKDTMDIIANKYDNL